MYIGGLVLALGIGLRVGWEACLKFCPPSVGDFYVITNNRDYNSNQEIRTKPFQRLDLMDVDFKLFGMTAQGKDENGNEYSGKIYPLSRKAYIELKSSNSGK